MMGLYEENGGDMEFTDEEILKRIENFIEQHKDFAVEVVWLRTDSDQVQTIFKPHVTEWVKKFLPGVQLVCWKRK